MKKLFLYAFLSFAISSYCQTAEDYFKSGLSKLQLEDREGAIADFTKAIQLKPNYVYAYSNRGVAKKDLKDYQGALEDFTKAIELDPKFEGSFFNRADVKYILNDFNSRQFKM